MSVIKEMIVSGLCIQRRGNLKRGFRSVRDQNPRNEIERPFVQKDIYTTLKKSNYVKPLNQEFVENQVFYNNIFGKTLTPDEKVYMLREKSRAGKMFKPNNEKQSKSRVSSLANELSEPTQVEPDYFESAKYIAPSPVVAASGQQLNKRFNSDNNLKIDTSIAKFVYQPELISTRMYGETPSVGSIPMYGETPSTTSAQMFPRTPSTADVEMGHRYDMEVKSPTTPTRSFEPDYEIDNEIGLPNYNDPHLLDKVEDLKNLLTYMTENPEQFENENENENENDYGYTRPLAIMNELSTTNSQIVNSIGAGHTRPSAKESVNKPKMEAPKNKVGGKVKPSKPKIKVEPYKLKERSLNEMIRSVKILQRRLDKIPNKEGRKYKNLLNNIFRAQEKVDELMKTLNK